MSIERVTFVEHFNEKTFRFRTTRPDQFNFVPGQFTMLGLPSQGSDLMRAYSICSSSNDPYLEFYSIKAPSGAFTTDLQRIIPGDEIEVSTRPVGSLLLNNLTPGTTLWMLATGTGIAPFVSIARDPATYQKYEQVVIVHSTRHAEEQAYAEEFLSMHNVWYIDLITGNGDPRITTLLTSNTVDEHYLPGYTLTPENDRIMICGNEEFVKETKHFLANNGWVFGTNRTPGTFVFEKAFVA